VFLILVQLLDLILGKGHDPLFRRAELKTLVDMHGNAVRIP
jgi:metal transporter CNNM